MVAQSYKMQLLLLPLILFMSSSLRCYRHYSGHKPCPYSCLHKPCRSYQLNRGLGDIRYDVGVSAGSWPYVMHTNLCVGAGISILNPIIYKRTIPVFPRRFVPLFVMMLRLNALTTIRSNNRSTILRNNDAL